MIRLRTLVLDEERCVSALGVSDRISSSVGVCAPTKNEGVLSRHVPREIPIRYQALNIASPPILRVVYESRIPHKVLWSRTRIDQTGYRDQEYYGSNQSQFPRSYLETLPAYPTQEDLYQLQERKQADNR